MDNTPESNSISLPSRSRGDPTSPTALPDAGSIPHRAQQSVTGDSRRENAASSAVNSSGCNGAAAPDNQDDEDDEDDYTSSSGSSLSSSEDEDDAASRQGDTSTSQDSSGLTSLPARRKPNIRRLNPQPSILSKISAFLPQMKSANEGLQREIEAGRGKEYRVDNDDEEGHEDKEGGEGRQYIEMNLGLGVLEEKRPGEDDEEFGHPESHAQAEDTNLMDRLMGKEKTASSGKPNIQDLGE
ncbi:hypothetical protein BDV06DRAFT_183897 [Aspergillus oleicola]